jgi:hypothetical protein
MNVPTVALSAYATGFETEAEFDKWGSYVAARIDDVCGFEVAVDMAAFSGREVST